MHQKSYYFVLLGSRSISRQFSRPTILLLLLTVFLTVSTVSYAADPESETASTEKPSRTLWTTSHVLGSPEPPPPYTVERVFPHLTFKEPSHLLLGPARKRYFLTQYAGKVFSFVADEETKKIDPFLELKMNILSIEFHPRFEENRFVYVFGNTSPQKKPGVEPQNQILRFEVTAANPPQVDLSTKQVVLQYDSNGHNGGEAKFGPDGFLYVTSGDGTGDSDGWNTGQDVSNLNATMYRIDVDHPDSDRNYGIPEDNPFVELDGARAEIWAYGFRNPWRFSFDRETGNLYVGDVGQDLWEMIHLVQRGGNYGWSVKEGKNDFHPLRKRGPTPIVPPLVQHHHTESRSITGGHVYHGSQLPKLEGVYLYGDYETGKIWGLRHEQNQITWHKELANLSLKVPSFATGINGEFLLVGYQSGELYRLVPAPAAASVAPFPRRLSETGIFSSTEKLEPSPGLIPYTVNAPQWTDGTQTQRYIGLPGDTQIVFANGGMWTFPEATVLVKTISLPAVDEESVPRHIETQILTLQTGQWAGYTYVWNEQQTDAELAPAEGMELTLTVEDASEPNGQREQPWRVVSRSECMVCHSRAAGFALGPQTAQMNRDDVFAPEAIHQLRAIEQTGAFTAALPESLAELPQLADPYDERADLAARSRAYLHANCSHCHIGAGGGNAKIVLSAQTKLAEMFLLGGRPLHADFGIAGAMLVAPGDPERSVLYHRISRRGIGQMPPLATHRVDEAAAKLIYQWIKQLEIPRSAQAEVDRSIAEVQGESGILSRWYVSEPQSEPADDEVLSRLAIAPAENKDFTWQPAIGVDAKCRIVLKPSTAAGANSTWLARTDVIVSQRSEIQLIAESGQELNVWLNGAPLREIEQKGSGSASYEAVVHQGRNRILLKILGSADEPPAFQVSFRHKSSNPTHEKFTVAALTRSGDAQRGRTLFLDTKKSQCIKCHRIGNEGGEVGPELTGVGGRLSLARIIESVLEPSRTVAPNYRMVTIELVSGRVINGITASETRDAVTIIDDQAQELVISKSEIEVMQVQDQSLMPEGLEKLISEEEFVDLVAYLSSLKASASADEQQKNTK